MNFLPEVIAEACHEANRVLTRRIGDVPVQPEWRDAPPDMRSSCVKGVLWRTENRAAPADAQHAKWMEDKLADGWTLGPERDPVKKTHPALVPYEKLPPGVQAKDKLFTAIVLALAE
jgi:hypothetical protein